MERKLHEVDWKTFSDEVFTLFGTKTPLLTAGEPDHLNTMVIGWGGLGTLWGMPVCTVYVRPERYTYEFMEQYDRFTVSVFDEAGRKATALCGRESGRTMDKAAACGLHAAFASGGAPYFEEAELVLACRKLYAQDLSAEHLTEGEKVLPYYGASGGWHRMYIGAVEQVLRK